MIRRFGTRRLRVNGFSTLASIWPGDVVCVQWRPDAYGPGDIILYTRNGRLFVHRLVEMVGETTVTRDDRAAGDGPSPARGRSARPGCVDRAGRDAGRTDSDLGFTLCPYTRQCRYR